jgi:hypothetical protein
VSVLGPVWYAARGLRRGDGVVWQRFDGAMSLAIVLTRMAWSRGAEVIGESRALSALALV